MDSSPYYLGLAYQFFMLGKIHFPHLWLSCNTQNPPPGSKCETLPPCGEDQNALLIVNLFNQSHNASSLIIVTLAHVLSLSLSLNGNKGDKEEPGTALS
jgi:hypothetical protein